MSNAVCPARRLTEADAAQVCALMQGNPLFYRYHPPQPTPEERREKRAQAREASKAAGAARAERLRRLIIKNARGKRPPDGSEDKNRKDRK